MAGQAGVPPGLRHCGLLSHRAAVRKSDRELKDAIDRAWDELDRSGQLARVFARWHIPYDASAISEAGAAAVPIHAPGASEPANLSRPIDELRLGGGA